MGDDQRTAGARPSRPSETDAAALAFRRGVTGGYLSPALLSSDHELERFECRCLEQTLWLRRHARQSAGTGATKVLVVTPATSTEVVAYYAWSMASLAVDTAPPRLRKGAGRYPQPVALLARLGVSIHHERRGLGAGLLQDVIARTAAVGREIGCRGLTGTRRDSGGPRLLPAPDPTVRAVADGRTASGVDDERHSPLPSFLNSVRSTADGRRRDCSQRTPPGTGAAGSSSPAVRSSAHNAAGGTARVPASA